MQNSVAIMIARVLLGKVFCVAVIQIIRQGAVLRIPPVLTFQLYLLHALFQQWPCAVACTSSRRTP